MDNLIQQTKYKAETISIIMDFGDVLGTSTISGTPTVTITVATGTDSNPSGMLYQGVTVTRGQVVEQRIRLGIPGNIYCIVFAIVSNTGQEFERESYLAILPEDSVAVPTWLPLWETTAIYPYQVYETMQGNITLTTGRLVQNVANVFDSMQGNIGLQSGTLITNGIIYNIPHEDIQGNIQLLSGTLVANGILYTIVHEDLKGDIALISGTLVNVGLNYSIPHEDLQGNITLIGGTLV